MCPKTRCRSQIRSPVPFRARASIHAFPRFPGIPPRPRRGQARQRSCCFPPAWISHPQLFLQRRAPPYPVQKVYPLLLLLRALRRLRVQYRRRHWQRMYSRQRSRKQAALPALLLFPPVRPLLYHRLRPILPVRQPVLHQRKPPEPHHSRRSLRQQAHFLRSLLQFLRLSPPPLQENLL